MKKKSKGFTLIELLAVIVILAIIALIAVPIVLNLIEKSRKGAAVDSAYGLRKSAQLYYTSSLLENVNGSDIIFNCDKVNGCLSEDNKVKLDIDGTKPSNGKIEIKFNGEIIYSNIVINGYTCEMENKGEITCEKGGEDAPSIDKIAPTLILGEVVVTENSITVPYTVDDTEATITCEYGTDENYGSVGTIENETCVINGLTAETEYFYKITATDKSNNSGSIFETATTKSDKFVTGDAVALGGYNWHIIGEYQDSQNRTVVTLLMDHGQILTTDVYGNTITLTMNHCTDDTTNSTDCAYNGSYYVYSWNKSKIRKYLNETFLANLESKVENEIVETQICADPSRTNKATYGGYLMSELEELGLTTSCSNYVSDKVRLISYSEYWNMSPYYSEKDSSYPTPNVQNITRLSSTSDYAEWLYSSSIGSWWTMDAVPVYSETNIRSANYVSASGGSFMDYGESFYGIRPVITIVK